MGPLKGKLLLSLRDQTSLSSPANEATIELERGFSMGPERASVLQVKYTPRFDREGQDKVEVIASAMLDLPQNDMTMRAEASIKSPEQQVVLKAVLRAKSYLFAMEKNSRDPAPLSLIEASRSVSLMKRPCRLNAGMKLSPELTILGQADLSVHPRLKLTPLVAFRASDLKPSVVKLEASGASPGSTFGWKVDLVPARNEASIEVREAMRNGVWIAKATMPTDGAVGGAGVMLKREFRF